VYAHVGQMLIRIVIIRKKNGATQTSRKQIHRAKVDAVLPSFKSVVLDGPNSGTMAAVKTLI